MEKSKYLNLKDIEIRFVSLDNDIKNDIKDIFKGYNNITGECTIIETCESADCIVSPANSFGMMDGGIDATLTLMLSKEHDMDYIGKKVRKEINTKYFGEQPVGTCLLISTDNDKFPWLAHSPTMTVPNDVSKTYNAYYAFKSVLGEILLHNRSVKYNDRIRSVLTTTFATGYGCMELKQSLKQMKLAYDNVSKNEKCSWNSATDVENLLKKTS